EVAGPPSVRMVLPGIRAGLDRDEPVAAVGVGEAAAGAREVRVERRRVAVDLVRVASGGVRLPDLDERVRDRAPAGVEHVARDNDPLAVRLARMLARQVAVDGADVALAEDRAGRVVE